MKRDVSDAEEDGQEQAIGLPSKLELQRTRMIVGKEINYHVGEEHVEFELINVDPAIVNSLRRILIAEVPSVAIENVFFIDYDCVLPEEVLSHRLGLVPLAIDPDAIAWKEESADETNTVIFKLQVKCEQKGDGRMVHDKVFSTDLKWLQTGSEYPAETATTFASPQSPDLEARPAVGDHPILLAKLRKGQYIELEAHAVKGVGGDHAKFSPVSTAWHRLYPEIAVLQPVPKAVAAELAERIPEVFSMLERPSNRKGHLKVKNIREHEFYEAKVRDAANETTFQEYIQLRKRKEHHIFTIESSGSCPAPTLFLRAIALLRAKCENLKGML